jgi:hypothetical protein
MNRFIVSILGVALMCFSVEGQPQITEIVAINAASHADGDDRTPDWIEIHNPGAEPLNISGYHLTDDVEIPEKFTFPDGAMILGGGYLVVFASGSDEPNYTDASGNLHTNFSLDGDGDYLALNSPDGAVLQEFAPSYPKQFEDVSYGIGTSAAITPLVTSGSDATWHVPSADIGSDWKTGGFDAAAWNSSSVGIGYGHDALVSEGGDTRSAMWFGNPSVYLRVPFDVEDPSAITSLTLNMRFDDGFVAYINGTRIAAANAPDEAVLTINSTATAERPDDRVAVAEAFTISANSLEAGTNVLAIHGLNFSASGANSADFLALPELTALSTDAAGSFGYFVQPSPGEPNGESPLIGFVEDTKFSHDRGYYTDTFELTITTATPGATIIYTTDGTPPSPDTGNIFVDTMNGTIYTEPIAISETTTLRAMAMKTGYQSTNIDTQTYLFVDDIVRQDRPSDYPSSWGGGRADYDMDPDIVDHPDYADRFHQAFAAIPTLSLVFDPDAFFDRSTGIYQNPGREGPDWERPLSAEFMVPDDSEPGFQINAGVRVQGGSSRNTDTPKHSLSLRFRADYGAEKLRYPLFKNSPGGDTAVDRFDLLQLRPEYNFGWMHRHWYQALHALYGRDQWASDLFNAMGQNGSHGRWVHLFLNGIYWGLYDVHERPDADHMANYFGGTDDDYDTVNSSNATRGDLRAYNDMMDIAYGSIEDESDYNDIKEFLDIDAFIDYMILNAYVGNRDWDGHNWRAARRREPGAGYLFFPWDTEFAASHVGGGAFDPPDFFTTTLSTDVTDKNGNRRPTGLQQRLAMNDEYRRRYGDRVHAHFFNGGPLTPERAAAMWTARSASMNDAIVAESARWGDFRRDVNPGRWRKDQFDLYTRDEHYLPVHEWLLDTYIPQRSGIVLEQLRDRRLYPKSGAPDFSVHGGMVARGTEVLLGSSVQYTTDGSDPRLPGGNPNPNAISGSSLVLNESTHLKARKRTIFGDWSALTEAFFTVGSSDLRVSEIMYHPADQPRAEFVEIHNSADHAVSLAGLLFSNGVTFEFDLHSSIQSLAPGARLLVVRDLEAFKVVYGDVHNGIIAGSFQDGTSLSNSGETLTLSDPNNAVVFTVTYNDKAPWPTNADGQGRSLVYTGGDASFVGSWGASAAPNGGPGAADTAEPASLDILSAPLEIVRTSDVLMLTYSTMLAEAEISIQQSADLKVWADIEPEVLSETVDGDSRLVTVELPEDSAGFVRIVVVPGN